MAKQLITWQEKISATAYDTIYPETLPEQVHINNKIANNLGILPDVALDVALEKLSVTDKNIRSQGIATGSGLSIQLSVNVFQLYDGVVVRAKIPFDTEPQATLNVNNTGSKYLRRLDGELFDLTIKAGAWATFIYSSSKDSWIVQGWGTKSAVKTAVFTESGTWTVPAGITSVDVFVMGGGGGSGGTSSYEPDDGSWGKEGEGGGGGAGRITKKTVTVSPGNSISVTIGKGGTRGSNVSGTSGGTAGNGTNGGTSSFGTFASASGGEGGKGGSGTGIYSMTGGNGGSGSAGGGGGGGMASGGNGGNGDYCGGGGAGVSWDGTSNNASGGNGGTYGGGGGATSGTVGIGGTNGGKGGSYVQSIAPVSGTNTTSLNIDFVGTGAAGKNGTDNPNATRKCAGGAGGGGYGGQGGNGGNSHYTSSVNFYGMNGGGGGYGGNGYGNANTNSGNGGGVSGGGGGGYGGNATGSGGGGYGIGNYGKGGDGNTGGQNGADGICVITWIAQES